MKISTRVIIILGLAFILRLLLIVKLKTYLHPVPFEYSGIVENLLGGKGFFYHFLGTDYRSFNNPLYSFLMAGVFLLTGHSFFAMLFIQSFFSILVAFLVFLIGRRIFNENVAILAMILTAFHLGYIYYDIFNLIPLSIDTFFIMLIVFLFLKSRDDPNFLKMLGVGVLIGIGALSRGIIGALLIFLSVYIFFCWNKLFSGDKLRFIIALFVGTFVALAPWLIRNYAIHRELVFVSTTGETFWRGNNAYATGTSIAGNGEPIFNLYPENFRKKVNSLNELQQKKFFEKEAIVFIKNHPLDFVKLYIKKIYYFWWFSPQSGFSYPGKLVFLYKIFYGIGLIFAILGAISACISAKINKSEIILILFVIMAICLTQSLFYVEGRHRWLIEPLLFLFLAYGTLRIYNASLKPD